MTLKLDSLRPTCTGLIPDVTLKTCPRVLRSAMATTLNRPKDNPSRNSTRPRRTAGLRGGGGGITIEATGVARTGNLRNWGG